MAGVGLLGFLQLVILIKYLPKVKIPKRKWTIFILSFSILTLLWLAVFSKYIFYQYLSFDYSYLVVGSLAVFFTSILAAFLFKKTLLGAALFLAFTIASSFIILPLQKGLTFFEKSKIINKIEEVSSPSESWVVVDNYTFENLPLIAGRKQINGPQLYTDLKFWRQLDKNGQFEFVYNRQAHVLFVSNTAEPSSSFPSSFAKINKDMELVKGNVFKVKFACSDFVYNNVDFVLTTHKLNMGCTVPVDEVSYPKATFYIYKIKPAY